MLANNTMAVQHLPGLIKAELQHSTHDVEVRRKRAFVRLASPSILSVPMNDVFVVLMGLYL